MTLEEVFGQWRVIGERKYEIFHKYKDAICAGQLRVILIYGDRLLEVDWVINSDWWRIINN
jgi:hypothetical protein